MVRDDDAGSAPGYGTALRRASGDDVAAALWSRGRRLPGRSDEVRIEYDDGQGPGLRIGQPVRHARFGPGRVTALTRGLNVLCTVRFDGGETRTIDARYLTPDTAAEAEGG